MVVDSFSSFLALMSILLSPIFLMMLLYGYEDIIDFFYNVKTKTYLLFRHSVYKYRFRVLKKFYRKHHISVDISGIYYNVFKTCFPEHHGVAKFKQGVKKFLRENNNKENIAETVNGIVKLRYETYFWGSDDEYSPLLNNKPYKKYGHIIKTISSLTVEQFYLLYCKNITSIRYVDMTIQGYNFYEVTTWGDMPHEWVDQLEPKRTPFTQ